MGVDGIGSSDSDIYTEPPAPESSPEPASYEPPPEPAYIPPQDYVDNNYTSSSSDSSAADWQGQTIAAAEAYVAENPPDNGFGDKTAEQRAQDAFWENDPNRPAAGAAPAAAPAPEPEPEEDDLDPKNPANKPPEEAPVGGSDDGPVLPSGPGPIPKELLPPPPPPPTGPNIDFGQPPPPPPPTPTIITTVKGIIDSSPVRPTHDTSPGGTDIFGISTNPPPTPPSTRPPEQREPGPSMTPDSKVK